MSHPTTSAVEPFLQELRAKLLDLTTRNRLLAFRHGQSACLRVVDELPDQLFQGLLAVQAFTFQAVPTPSQRELLDYYTADDSAPRAKARNGELPLPKPEVWATHCGLDADYELPLDSRDERPARHEDRRIQTLLYADDLEKRLRKLRGDARTAVEETGSNLLHLAFGFLEWREPGERAKGNLAPLLLLPVELERVSQGPGRAIYRLTWSGEDLQPNLSLEKKLAEDFALTLPPLAEEPSVEATLTAVRRAVAEQPGWRVRRHATLGLFHFGKQLLYSDLDPASWPAGQGIAQSALVQQLLLGETLGGGFAAEARPAPTPESLDLDLELVERSDSSQSTALWRALAGESLVIQGPPGTGKSQTITNLIAAALARGKRVLFVSEKLAALEVVRRRLNAVGLGDFVLELHSHKTRKQALLQDLRARLSAGERSRAPASLDQRRALLRERRQALQDYAEAMAQPIGLLGWPVQKVLQQAGGLQPSLGVLAYEGPRIEGLQPLEVTAAERDAGLAALEQLAALAARHPRPLVQHPWAGLSAKALPSQADRHQAVARLRGWDAALGDLKAALAPLQARLGAEVLLKASAVSALAASADEIRVTRTALQQAQPLTAQILKDLGWPVAGDVGALRRAAAVLRLAAAMPPGGIQVPEALQDEARFTALKTAASSLQAGRGGLARHLRLGFDELPDAGDLTRLAATLESGGLFAFLSAPYRAAKRRVASIFADGLVAKLWPDLLRSLARVQRDWADLKAAAQAADLVPAPLDDLAATLDRAEAAKAWGAQAEAALGAGQGQALAVAGPRLLASLQALAREPAGAALLDLETRLAGLTETAEPLAALLERLAGEPLGSALAQLAPADFDSVLDDMTKAATAAQAVTAAEADFAATVDLDRTLWERPGLSQQARVAQALADPESLPDWLEVDRLLRGAQPPGVGTVMTALVQDAVPPAQAARYWDYQLLAGLAKAALDHYPALLEAPNGARDDLRRVFAEGDQALMAVTARAIAAQLAQVPIPAGRTGKRVSESTDLALIQRETEKQKRHLPIRQLVRRAGKALQALKPCFMMGPQSVAQYLEPGALTFDLVVFDEASQLRPEEAIGALARARQAVVVGDANQLAPTSFFQRTGEELEEEETGIAAAGESILEVAETRFDKVMLRWHYRSLHPDLIAFSNASFYGGGLQLFPSPRRDDPEFGVQFRYQPDGTFVGRQNQAEAEAIAAAAIAQLRDDPDKSLGLVAMNVEQRDLIAGLVERAIEEEPALAGRDLEAGAEPFFVKNLENVQGDERDVIMISMTYGPPEPGGKVPQRFGPINQVAGWRRLNVLFTRAKQRMEVFSSLREGDVAPGDGGSRGLQALKSFLHFAESGVLAEAARKSGRPADSDFETAVIEGLEGAGYACQPQVGSAGFFIDIGVLDPENPDRFLAGVECDGASYHSTRSARDRDHLRQAVLERLGWTILRVWSTDWFQDPDRCLSRLTARLEASGQPEPQPVEEPEQEADALPPVLSEADARQRLIALREAYYADNPEADRARGLLRKSMLQELLNKRPLDEESFRRTIRRDLREATEGAELRHYGDEVFQILERLA
ncbi:MAG: DUF4011 domain-containing protein [Pseudomonadota bacterium]